jgi:hypothetical protein
VYFKCTWLQDLFGDSCYNYETTSTGWAQDNFALDAPERAEYCSGADQCVTSSGACKKFDAYYTSTWICGNDNNWLKCDSQAQDMISDGGNRICDNNKWIKGSTNIKTVGDYTWKGTKWINTKWCKDDPKNCRFSDVVVKLDNSENNYFTSETAIDKGRIGIGKSTQCISTGHKAHNFGAVAGGKVCGNDNNWLLCYKDAQGIVSDDGNYVCNGFVWKKIKNTKKGCSSCTAKETCLGSDLDSGTGTTRYWNTNRIGCSNDPQGCVDKSGSDFNYGDVTLNKFLCYNNNWRTCEQKIVSLGKIISPDRSHVCIYQSGNKKYVWNECKIPGKMTNGGKTICTQEGWYKGKPGKTHIASEFAEYLFDGDHWNTCKKGGQNEGVSFSGYKCENGEWSFLYVDLSSISVGKTIKTTPKTPFVGTGGSGDDNTGDSGSVAPSGRRSR